LFKGLKSENTVWANHGDSVQKLPHDFMQIAQSQDHETIQAITNSNGSIIGVQFHPEVHHTISGNTMLLNFVKKAGCTPDWDPADIADSIRQEIADAVKNESGTKKVILGLSGGVDSSVTAALLHPILGDNLLCVVIDSGFLREGEPDEIRRTANLLGVNYIVIESEKRFYEALGGTTEPETKRAIFKRVYREILEEHIASFEADFIVQGSLATDFIESGKAGDSALIKSHHNIGIQWSVAEIHPLRTLFKYEVREIGQTLGLPDYITKRQPFPGPGLMVRVVGIPANPENTAIIRHCDIIVRRVLEKHQLYDQISQLVVYLSGTQTVGIKGDGRSYGYAAVLRPISTQDFMTCTVLDIPRDVIDEICTQVTKHSKITRLLYDYTPKPPGTTEAE
jgi:GMP synthase (glutamine-hydrolysing)